MLRLESYLGIFFALLIGAFIGLFSSGGGTIPRGPAATATTASSSLSVFPSFSVNPALDLPAKSTTTTAATSSTKPAKTVLPIVAPLPAPVASLLPTAPALVPLPSSGGMGLDATAVALRAALVNIMCYVPAGSGLHSISGSGVFIDAKGIILTNAHIAQYFLLVDRGVSCTIRSGSPAVDAYKAKLIYLSPLWVRANATVLTQVLPVGTGEYDFALLAVTKSATATPLPSSFPFIPLASLPPASGAPVVIASYGAQFIDVSQIQSALFPTVVFGAVKNIYTFATNTVDILDLGGSAAAQEGSSGGGVADASGSLVGMITTSTVEGATDTRSLSAITASYVRAEYAREMGLPLDSLLSESTAYAVNDFAPQVSVLEAIISPNLP